MSSKKNEPWKTPDGINQPDGLLAIKSADWDLETWNAFADSLERGPSEVLLEPDHYDRLADEQAHSIFRSISNQDTDRDQAICNDLLACLPRDEADVLRKVYLEAKSFREIAGEHKRSAVWPFFVRVRALSRLRKILHGDGLNTRHLMGGAFEFVVADIDSIWTRVSASLPKEARLYESFDQSRELENIAHPGLRSAMAALSAREKRIIYLHFWCERTVTEIARELRCGVNIVEQTMEATVLKLKRQLLANQIALDLESRGASCA